MKTRNNSCKSAKWMLATLLVAGAAFAYGTDARAALEANGVVVDGKVCREAERRVVDRSGKIELALRPSGGYCVVIRDYNDGDCPRAQ